MAVGDVSGAEAATSSTIGNEGNNTEERATAEQPIYGVENLNELSAEHLDSRSLVEKEAQFTIPAWCGKPPLGYHLDVLKGEKLMQKLMIDEKGCYFFGRNPKLCDFAVDHASCSRVHSALIYHKHLSRFFLIDLGSTHGTFIGRVRLEAHKMEQVVSEATFHFGASTRRYVLRSKLTGGASGPFVVSSSVRRANLSTELLSALPDEEEALNNLTEYNTALNRRVAPAPVDDVTTALVQQRRLKRKEIAVCFLDEETVINPEDVDPTIGRFRNLVQTAVIPSKRLEAGDSEKEVLSLLGGEKKGDGRQSRPFHRPIHPPTAGGSLSFGGILGGLSLPNPAPEVEEEAAGRLRAPLLPRPSAAVDDEPKKKKYVKEAWPGKGPGQHQTAAALLV